MYRVINVIAELREKQVSPKCSYPFSFILRRAGICLPPAYRSIVLSCLKNLPLVDVVKRRRKGKEWHRVVIYK
ncbi:MAG: hypothetical protein DRN49_06840 [Thaumarchaeota archaeon]|nr:MAG: hypothetical protein DRN49_06840 [Nitrososphaerota archaeon]